MEISNSKEVQTPTKAVWRYAMRTVGEPSVMTVGALEMHRLLVLN